jgi:putative ABC transport system substrate-binding protein
MSALAHFAEACMKQPTKHHLVDFAARYAGTRFQTLNVSSALYRAAALVRDAESAQARDQGSSLIVMPDPFNGANREEITLLAARYRVPAMYYRREFAEAGGLIAYASDFAEQFPQAAAYVDRILKGAKPADLPVQAPTKFDLVINLKTAKALGLDVPLGMQQRADELIE